MLMPDKDEIAVLAKIYYEKESGRRKAIDEGRLTMREFTIDRYIRAWVIGNLQDYPGLEGEAFGYERNRTLQKAFRIAASEYSIDEATARKIYAKVCRIPRVAQ